MKTLHLNFGDDQLGISEVGNIRVKVIDRFTVINRRLRVCLLLECVVCHETRRFKTGGFKDDVDREIANEVEKFYNSHRHGECEEEPTQACSGRGDGPVSQDQEPA